MTARHVSIAVFAASLSACTWLPWSHRPPVRPAPSTTSTAASASTTHAPIVHTTAPPAPRPPAPRHPAVAAHAERPAPARADHAREPSAPAGPSPAPVRGLDLHGELRLEAGRGQQLHNGEIADTVVYFVPAGGAPRPRPRHRDVITAHRDFTPTAIAIPLGSTLTYVNKDTVRHNVFSVTPGAAFNLGYQPAGTRDDHVFANAGLVLVNCNVHHTMEMDVMVVPSRYASRVAADGTFTLRGLPAGRGELVAWNPRARLQRKPVALPAKAPVSLLLLAERPRVVTRIDIGGMP